MDLFRAHLYRQNFTEGLDLVRPEGVTRIDLSQTLLVDLGQTPTHDELSGGVFGRFEVVYDVNGKLLSTLSMCAGIEKDQAGVPVVVCHRPPVFLQKLQHPGGVDAILGTTICDHGDFFF